MTCEAVDFMRMFAEKKAMILTYWRGHGFSSATINEDF